MNPQLTSSRETLLKRTLIAASVFVIGFYLYVIVSSIINTGATGTLKVTSSNSKAVLSVSQANHQAKPIGTGSASVHLSPGVYQVSASYGTSQANTTVQINKKSVVSIILKFKAQPVLPSVANIDFTNIDTLLDSGLTTTQINILKQDFFHYKQTAQKISIIPSSVYPGPHNPNASTSFSVTFGVVVDSASYNASISYSSLTDVQLRLYNPQNNALLFDSYAANAAPTE